MGMLSEESLKRGFDYLNGESITLTGNRLLKRGIDYLNRESIT